MIWNTKRYVAACIAFVLSAGVAGCGKASAPKTGWDTIKERGTIVVATDGNYYPDTYHDTKTNQLAGFEVDLVNEMSRRLGLKVEYKTMSFDGILPALRNGQIDLGMEAFDITPERQKTFDFTIPYDFSYGTMIVRASDDSGIHSLADLKGKRIGGVATSVYDQFGEKYGAQVVVYTAGADTLLHDVINGRIDAILNDHVAQMQALKLLKDPRLKIEENIRFLPSQSGLVMKKDNTDLKAHLDKVIQQMLDDGTISKLSLQYFDIDVTKPVNISAQ